MVLIIIIGNYSSRDFPSTITHACRWTGYVLH